MDSDALAGALLVPCPIYEEEAAAAAAAPVFNWDDYSNITARMDFSTLSTLDASVASTFQGETYLIKESAIKNAYPLSVVCWFKSNADYGAFTQGLFWVGDKSVDNAYQRLYINTAGVTVQSNEGGTADTSSEETNDPMDGGWHMAGCTINQASRIAYFDDNAGTENTTDIAKTSTYDRTTVGAHGGANPSLPNLGTIQHMMVFGDILSAAEMTWLYNSGAGRSLTDLQTSEDAGNPGTDDLLAYWPIWEESGARTDQSGAEFDLAPVNWKAMASFTHASDQYFTSTAVTNTAYPYTAVAWVRPYLTGANNGVWASGRAVNDLQSLYITNNLAVTARADNGTANGSSSTANGSVLAGRWNFVAGIMQVASRQAYCNGTAATAQTTSVAQTGAYTDTFLGGFYTATTTNAFEGEIDYLAVWNSALTTTQLDWLYNSGKGRTLREMVSSSDANNPGTPWSIWSFKGEATGDAASDQIAAHAVHLADVNTVVRTSPARLMDPTQVAGVVYTECAPNDHAATFNAGYLEVASVPISAYPFSVSLWVKTEHVETEGLLFSFGQNGVNYLGIEANTNGTVEMRSWGVGLAPVTVSTIDDGDWHHILAVFTGATDRSLSLDGAAFVTSSSSIAFSASYTHTAIGRAANSGKNFDFGEIDEVMLFNSALSVTDASELYNAGRGYLARGFDNTILTSGKTPLHSWNMSSSNEGSARGRDMVRTGTPVDMTEGGGGLTDAVGIPAGSTSELVARAQDQSGNANHLLMATLATRPRSVYVTDGTTYGVKTAAGTFMQSAAFSGALSQPNTIMVLADVTDLSADQALCDGIVTTSEQRLGINGTLDVILADSGAPANSSISAGYGAIHAYVAIFQGTGTRIFKDGGAGEPESTGTETMTGLTLGTQFDGATDPATAVYRQLVVNNGALTTDELDEIGGYWQTTFGITWTAASTP